jgi:GNAT superfamily N-acetyltransferase
MIAGSRLRIETVAGAAIEPLLPDLARLRISIFRAYPYLYDGDLEYEARYLRRYLHNSSAIIVCFDGGRVVGASTCMKLSDETTSVTAPFVERGLDLGRFFYFGESVLEPSYRGRGVGAAFFERREAHVAAVSDCDICCFCAVQRAADDPRRPPDYQPLDAFWRRRGYISCPDLVCAMSWKEVGADAESEQRLGFWMKSLRGVALP